MLARIVALLIALALFWSGFTVTRDGSSAFAGTAIAETQAEFAAESKVQPPTESPYLGADESPDEPLSEAQHLPSQAEGPSDLPEVIIVLAEVRALGVAALPPLGTVRPLLRSPYLDGPQRPPRQPRLLG